MKYLQTNDHFTQFHILQIVHVYMHVCMYLYEYAQVPVHIPQGVKFICHFHISVKLFNHNNTTCIAVA